MSTAALWYFLPIGYLFTVLIETPVLLAGLSGRHPPGRRIFAGLWLTACTYPVVNLVMPLLFADSGRGVFLAAAETFAPAAECVLFWAAFGERREWGRASMWRDFAAITVANLASFAGGEVLNAHGWFGLLDG